MFSRAITGQLFVGARPFALDYSRNDRGDRTGYRSGPEEEVVALKKMFRWYADGMSLADVTEKLNKLGVRTRKGSEWDRNKVHAILTNPVYAGDYVFGRVSRRKQYRVSGADPSGHVRRRKNTKKTKHDIQRNPESEWFVVKDAHPALIDRDLSDKVQTELKARQRHTSPSRVKGQHPLSGLLFCPACGHVMYGTTRPLKTRVPVYVCGNYSRSLGCEGYWVREDEALVSIAKAIQKKLEDRGELEWVKNALLKQQSSEVDDEVARVAEVRQRVNRLDAQIAEATARIARVPERLVSGVPAEIEKMESERDAAHAELARVKSPSGGGETLDVVVARVRRLVEVIQGGDPDRVHEFLREAIERVDLTFRVVRLKKNSRYHWEAGTLQLRGSSELSVTGRGR